MTTTESPEALELLRTILADPADDAARLVYSDWLEEHGDMDRAAFIRAGIAIASHGYDKMVCDKTGTALSHAGGPALFVPRCRCRPCSLSRREYMASRRHLSWDWVGGVGIGWYGRCGLTWRRGFVSKVRCSLEQWIGGECNVCEGDGQFDDGTPCPCCPRSSPGRTLPLGPVIMAAHPVTDVAFPHVGLLSSLPRFLSEGWASGHWRPVVSANAIKWAKGQLSC